MTKRLTPDEKVRRAAQRGSKVQGPKRRPVPALVNREGPEGKLVSLTPAGLVLVENMAAEGCHRSTIGRLLGSNKKGLAKLLERDEATAEAFEVGRGRLWNELSNILLTHARGGDVTAAIFLSKALLGWRDHGNEPGADAPKVAVNITMTAPMSPGDFAKLIEQEPKDG